MSFKIESFMIERLGLSGNDLVLYAYLYDVTKGGERMYEGNHRDLVSVLNCTIPTVYKVLANLEVNGLIVREPHCKAARITVVKQI